MRNCSYIFLLLFLLVCVLVFPAKAQVVGDPCVGTSTSAVILGESQTLVCDGAVFKLMIETDTAGRSNLQIDDDTANVCDATKLGRLAYDDGTDTWQYCDGANWVDLVGASGGGGVVPFFFDFTDLYDQAVGTTISSDIVLISGIGSALQVTIAGGGTPQFQICDDFDCSTVDHAWGNTAQNIDNGQYLQLRLTTPTTELTLTQATVSVGDAVADWNVTTIDGLTVFVTSTQYNGSAVGGVAGADSICNTRAAAGGLSGTYKAWIADTDPNSAPATRFTNKAGSLRPYIMPNGTLVANDWADLTDNSIDNNFNVTELSGTGSSNVWTNVRSDGTQQQSSSSWTCYDWGSTSGNSYYGRSYRTDSGWTQYNNLNCNNNNRLYCFEDGASSGSTSTPVPSYEQEWIFLGSFDSTRAGTCFDCDTGLDIPEDAVEAVFLAFSEGTDTSWSSETVHFITGTSIRASTASTSTPNCRINSSFTWRNCIVLSPPGVYGTATANYEILDASTNTTNDDRCELEMKVGDASVYYDDSDSSYDCAFAVYYR